MCLAGNDPAGRAFVDQSMDNCTAMGLKPTPVGTPAEIKRNFPAGVATGAFEGRAGYMNTTGGWGEAARAIEVGHKRIRRAGGVIRGGAEVVNLQKEGNRVIGVVLKDGEVVPADLVIVSPHDEFLKDH